MNFFCENGIVRENSFPEYQRLFPLGRSWAQIFKLLDFSRLACGRITYIGQVLVRLFSLKLCSAKYLVKFASSPYKNNFLEWENCFLSSLLITYFHSKYKLMYLRLARL